MKTTFLRKSVGILATFALVLTSIGMAPLRHFFSPLLANATVGTPTVVDGDTTGFGVDGRDFTVVWTPEGSAPAGYSGREFFIIPFAQSVTAANIKVNECTGASACLDSGFVFEQTENSFTLPEFFQNDANGDALASVAYKVCVYTFADTPTLDCSATFTPTSDAPTDNMAPFVMHPPYHSLIEGVTDAVFHALIYDEQTTTAEFTNTGDGGDEYFRLHYGADVSTAEETPLDGVNVTGKLFSFTVPGAFVNANSSFEYYIIANDKNNNASYFCPNPMAASQADCKGSPFVVNAIPSGAISIAGTINDNSTGNGLDSATVYLGGIAKAAVTAGSGGTAGQFTISGLPANLGGTDIMAYKSGFCDMMRFENVGSSNLTGVDFGLNPGECGGGPPPGGGPGAGGAPFPVFSDPPPNMGGFPLDRSILVGFSSALNSATVNDANATDAGSNIYLTTDDGTTKIAGNVKYCEDNSAAGCGVLFTMDTNVILFTPGSALSADTFYTLVITSAVTSSDGQAVQGNRPGGGEELSFSTGGGVFNSGDITTNFGNTGQYMPPYVEAMTPGPGNIAPTNTKILIKFNERMDSTTVTTTSVTLFNITGGANTQVTLSSADLSLDSTGEKLTIDPGTLTSGQYELRLLGSIANASGIGFRPPDEAGSQAFSSFFEVGSSSDSTPPTIYPGMASGSTGVPVNDSFFFGTDEQLDPGTVTTANITVARGSNSVSVAVEYNPGMNEVIVIPNNVMAASTTYTITFSTSVTDLSGNALASAQAFSYTTGSADIVKPKLMDVRCDDYTCAIFFDERMNGDTAAGSRYANSALNPSNLILNSGGVVDLSASGITINYMDYDNMTLVEGLSLTVGNTYSMTVSTNVQDVSNNALNATGGINVFNGTVEDSANTFGEFGGGGGGMFGPPIAGGGGPGGEFVPEGFGSFTAEQFAFGNADMAFPFNPTAGQDVNVFQVRFAPGQVLQDNDQVVIIFPNGTGLANITADTYSPFFADMNEFGAGTVAFDTAYDTDGVGVDTAARKVTVQLAITGTPGANDNYTIDLRKITNPAIPRGPESGGYTVQIKVLRAGSVLLTKESMPYFISQGGSNSITVRVFAGNQGTPDNVAGSLFLFGGGPSGPMDKNLTLAAGVISAVEGTVATEVVYSNLNDGCYYFGTEPYVNLGGSEYFGQMAPEPVCMDSGNPTAVQNIVLTTVGGGASVTLNVDIAGVDFGTRELDIFAGGPGRFVVRTITPGDTTGAAYSTTISLPLNGNNRDDWYVGVGPAMSKGPSASMPEPLPGMPPPPTNLIVDGSDDSISPGWQSPGGVTFNDGTDTVTFTFAAADKTISGTVTDGTNPLSNIDVFVHSAGFGAGMGTMTGNDGTFSINVSNFGVYELGAFNPGLNPVFRNIDIMPDGADAGTDPDIFVDGKQITGANPLVIKLKKPSYMISGKVLDSGSNPIPYAPVFGSDANGNPIFGMTGSDGSYTLFVDAGTWTLKSELPPDKTDECGTFSRTVTVTTENKANQNITPTAGSCYTLSGTVTIGGSTQANVPVFIEAWNTGTDMPTGGLFRPSSTNSSGVYSAKVSGNTTYRVGTFDPDFGEFSTLVVVVTSDVTDGHINSGTTGTITFSFTGGAANMEAFVEVKLATDRHSRRGELFTDLTQSHQISMKEGTYNYFVNIFGFGDFTGTVATGATATIDLSGTNVFSLGGNIKDGNTGGAGNLVGALVTVMETTTGAMQTTTTDSSGDYSFDALREGTYTVDVKKINYVDPREKSDKVVAIAANTTVDFGGASGGADDELAPVRADNVIQGTILKSDASTPLDEGFVSARNTTTGEVISAPVNPQDGTYDIPVTDGTWEVKASGSLHARTTLGTVVVAGGDETQNGTLTADATKVPKATTTVLSANTGGTINDSNNTGVKINVGPGVLVAGSDNVTINVEKEFTAPEISNFKDAEGDNYQVLDDAVFEIKMSTTSIPNITDLLGNVEFTFEFEPTDLPSGIVESDLILAYLDDAGNPVPFEGGFNIDQENNTITGLMNHLTEVVILTPPAVPAAPAPAPAPSGGGGGGGGGGGFIGPMMVVVPAASISGIANESLIATVTGDGVDRTVIYDVLTVVLNDTYTNSEKVSVENSDLKLIDLSGEPLVLSDGAIEMRGTAPNGDTDVAVAWLSTEAPSIVKVYTQEGVSWSGTIFLPKQISRTSMEINLTDDEDFDSLRITSRNSSILKVGAEAGVSLEFSENQLFSVSAPDKTTGLSIFALFSSIDGENWVKEEDSLISYDRRIAAVRFTSDRATYFLILIVGEGEVLLVPLDFVPVSNLARDVLRAVQREFVRLDIAEWKWSRPYVEKLMELDIAQGYSDGKFHPDWNINRAEFVKMILETFNVKIRTSPEDPFPDVSLDDWYVDYVYTAQTKGFIEGYPDGTFGAVNNVNRAEAMVIIARVAGLLTEGVKSAGLLDVPADSWYEDAVNYAVNYNIAKGVGSNLFDAGNSITRGQAAKILVNILYHLGEI